MITVEEVLAEVNKSSGLILPRENVHCIEGKSLDEVYRIIDENGGGRRGWPLYLLNGSLPDCTFARKTSQLFFTCCNFRNTEFNGDLNFRYFFTDCNLDGTRFVAKRMVTVGFRICHMAGTVLMPDSTSQVVIERDWPWLDSIKIDTRKHHWIKRDLYGQTVLWLEDIPPLP